MEGKSTEDIERWNRSKERKEEGKDEIGIIGEVEKMKEWDGDMRKGEREWERGGEKNGMEGREQKGEKGNG